jgi:glycosyltransferase involved in cell wall biosynthesis
LEQDLQSAHVTFCTLAKKGRWDVVPFFLRLLRFVQHEKPQILYALLGVPCILSVFLKLFSPQMKIVWGVRASNVDLSRYERLSVYAYRLECFLSRFADLIISNSHAGRDYAIKHGFPRNVEVIPNGIDVDYFKPDIPARQKIHEEWKIENDEILVGLVARLDPMKDHHTFLAAASLVATKCSNAKFMCIGGGPAGYASELRAAAKKYGLDDKIIWAGAQNEMRAIYNSLDMLVSSSCYGEGFSNAIAEAMACSIPCVVTDVGDSAWIVSETGIAVSPQNPEALADGIVIMFTKTEFLDGTLQRACRQRIIEKFGIEHLVDNTTTVFERLLCSG